MKITFLGVWMTSEYGENVSFLMELDSGEKILVDTGNNPIRSLASLGLSSADITDLIITHLHGDHISGFPAFMFHRITYLTAIDAKPDNNVNIIASKECFDGLMNFLSVPYPKMVTAHKFKEHVINTLPHSFDFNSQYRFTFFKSKHSPLTTGFVLFDKKYNKKIVYSGDSAFSEDILAYAQGADCLIYDITATCRFKKLNKTHCMCEEISSELDKYDINIFIPIHRMAYYKNNMKEYLNGLSDIKKTTIVIPNELESLEI